MTCSCERCRPRLDTTTRFRRRFRFRVRVRVRVRFRVRFRFRGRFRARLSAGSVALAGLLASCPAYAQSAPEGRAELDALRDRVARLESFVAQESRRRDEIRIFGLGPLFVFGLLQTRLTGVITQGESDSTAPPSSFTLPRARLGIYGEVKAVSYVLSGELGQARGIHAGLADAYLRVRTPVASDAPRQFEIRAGQLKLPLSHVEYIMDAAAEERLQQYINGIGEVLGHPRRREAFASYTLGLLSDLERKSIEPMAALTCPDLRRLGAVHQSLCHFISTSDWDDRAVRSFAAQYAMEAMGPRHRSRRGSSMTLAS